MWIAVNYPNKIVIYWRHFIHVQGVKKELSWNVKDFSRENVLFMQLFV